MAANELSNAMRLADTLTDDEKASLVRYAFGTMLAGAEELAEELMDAAHAGDGPGEGV